MVEVLVEGRDGPLLVDPGRLFQVWVVGHRSGLAMIKFHTPRHLCTRIHQSFIGFDSFVWIRYDLNRIVLFWLISVLSLKRLFMLGLRLFEFLGEFDDMLVEFAGVNLLLVEGAFNMLHRSLITSK